MNWDNLLNANTYRTRSPLGPVDKRNAFENDYMRLIFSAPVRRLQDKAQVFPLDNSDFVRTRLTHSLEVSSIGRSIGISVERILSEKRPDLFKITEHSGKISSILAAAGLIHDLGNPPYGHYGESAIQNFFKDWFKNNEKGKAFKAITENADKVADFENFEGNAQTFRLLKKLQFLKDEKSFNLTYATLASVIKYPRSSTEGNKDIEKEQLGISFKKFGYFQAEKTAFLELIDKTGIGNCRHPLAFLLEAADDIAYSAADLEDGCKKKVLDFNTIEEVLRTRLSESPRQKDKELYKKFIEFYESAPALYEDKLGLAVQLFRIEAQGDMISSVVNKFVEKQDEILSGKFDEDIILASDSKNVRKAFKDLAKIIFKNREIVMRELAGQQVICGLLNLFVEAVTSDELFNAEMTVEDRKKSGSKAGKLYSLISDNYRYIMETYPLEKTGNEISLFDRLLLVTDFICGMTDTYALEFYRQLTGIKL